jgi:hypothetical protein
MTILGMIALVVVIAAIIGWRLDSKKDDDDFDLYL